MKIIINGKEASVEKNEISILDFLRSKNIHPDTVAVELNSVIVKRNDFEKILITASDKVEIVQFVGGG
jgi:thiamine biosynthesis protein ThiS